MTGHQALDLSLTDEIRYRLLVHAVTDYAIYMLDPAGFVASWNPGAEKLKGYAAAQIIGRHFSCFYVEADREAGLPDLALATALREGKFEQEGWRLRRDGARFWASVLIEPIRGDSGALLGFAKVTRDLSERHAWEAKLRRSEEQFRRLVQAVTDYAIFMLDPEGHVVSWNSGAERIKGYAPEAIIGSHISRFYTPQDQERGEPKRGLETAAREGRFESEGWRLRHDGARFWAHVVIDRIVDENGRLLGFAKVTRDITERRQAERTLEETREALFQSQKMEAIGQLTGGIAHDFNNLLMAVLGSLELVRMRLPADPGITPLLNNAILGAQRGAALTRRMLAFARRQKLHAEPIDIKALVVGMVDLLQRSLGALITVETQFPADLGEIEADANQLELALLNLVVNARDAMPEGGRIVIAARAEPIGRDHGSGLAPGHYVCLSVTDRGEGMDQATLERAVEPFFTTKDIGKGTGLGLSMVHGLTQQLGGRLILKSRKGEGTRAELWLPMAGAGTAPGTALETSPLPPAAAAPRPLFVLAVDDDDLVLLNTTMMLKNLGHAVLEASCGQEALRLIEHEAAIDLVIADQGMPKMNGLQLAETIRAARPNLPIILTSGFAGLPPVGAADLPKLAKPYTQGDLADAVARATDPMRRRRSS